MKSSKYSGKKSFETIKETVTKDNISKKDLAQLFKKSSV